MKTIHFPNLMFEDELGTIARRPPAEAARVVSELAPLMGLLAPDSDCSSTAVSRPDETSTTLVIVSEGAMPCDLPAALKHVQYSTLTDIMNASAACDRFVPWGWSEQAVELSRKLAVDSEVPDSAVVRDINSRAFLSEFDVSFPVNTLGQCTTQNVGRLCFTLSDVSAALDACLRAASGKWVIKANFSQAARNRLLGQGLSLDSAQQGWLKRKLEQGEPVYVEPWLDRIAECGLQFWVPPPTSKAEPLKSGQAEPVPAVSYLGGCEMLTDKVGRYRGSIVAAEEDPHWWDEAVSHCRRISEIAGRRGFFGPIGFDCMMFREASTGQAYLRPCHDINGRMTMGRLALSLRKWLQPGETGVWCHAFAKSGLDITNVFEDLKMKNVRIVPTSPRIVGGQSTNLQTVFLISDECESLNQVVRKILSQDIRGPFSSTRTTDRAL